MKKKTRIAAILCAAAVITAAVPTSAAAEYVTLGTGVYAEEASGTCGENLTWTYDDAGVLTISGAGVMDDFEITPWNEYKSHITDVIIENGITSIGANAFNGFEKLTSITIPDSISVIGDSAFCSTALTSAILPDNLTYIGSHAFELCKSLTSIKIPDNVTGIGMYAFSTCTALENVSIPDSVTYIDTFAFDNCYGITSIVIPESVTSVGYGAFYACENLTSITFENAACEIYMDNWTIPNTATIYGHYGSTAEEYASAYGCQFALLLETVTDEVKGDADGDGDADLDDASKILTYYAMTGAGLDAAFDEDADQNQVLFLNADVNGDSAITLDDASYILSFYAQTGAGLTPSWDAIIGA